MPEPTKLDDYTINDIVGLVAKIETKRPPSLVHYQGMTQYFEELRTAMDVVNEYKSRDAIWDPQKMSEDVVFLSSVHATMSEMVGYLQGGSRRAESSRKYMKSQYVLSIKSARNEVLTRESSRCKLTETEIDHAARVLNIDQTNDAFAAETVSRIISNAWYAIGDFVKTLGTALYRANKEFDNTRT
jgi:hypothetical protein